MKYTHQPAVAAVEAREAVAAREAVIALKLTEAEAQALRELLNKSPYVNDLLFSMRANFNHYLLHKKAS